MAAAKASLREPEGKKALDYLKDVRKFSDEIIDKFDIGYCPLNINHDVRGRIITPVYDTYGELIALSTRHLNEEMKKGRFLHETYDKGSYLYGLCYAKDSIQKTGKAIIVEGEFDVACLHSYGLDMTVGLGGSAFTLFQIALLAKYCKNYYLMLDPDEAGSSCIERAMKEYRKYNLEAYGLKFIPVKLPPKTDPDKYVIEYGKKGMIEKLKTAREDSEFVI